MGVIGVLPRLAEDHVPEVAVGPLDRRLPPSEPTCTVLQLVLSLSPGGTERLVVELVSRLPAHFRSIVCCLDSAGAWGEELMRSGITVLSLDRRPGFRPSLASRIAAIVSRHQVDVIHCHHYSPYVYGQLAARLQPRVRVVFTEHGRLSDAAPSLKRRLVNQLLGRLPASIYGVSEDLRGHLVAEGFPVGRVGVISNGIDVLPPASPAQRATTRNELGLASNSFVVGTVGRLDPVKDLAVLLDGFARFRLSAPTAILVVVGDGQERAPLVQRAAAIGLADAVRFLGHREDVRDLLASFDVYVSTSIFEGVSLTILEAMAAQVPVIATAVGGTPEVVVDGETGRLIPARSPQAVETVLREISTSAPMAAAWGRAGRQRVIDRFTIDAMVQQYGRVYTGSTDGSARHGGENGSSQPPRK